MNTLSTCVSWATIDQVLMPIHWLMMVCLILSLVAGAGSGGPSSYPGQQFELPGFETPNQTRTERFFEICFWVTASGMGCGVITACMMLFSWIAYTHFICT